MGKKMILSGVWNFGFKEIALEDASPETILPDSITVVPGCFDTALPLYGKCGTALYSRTVHCSGKVKLTIGALGLEGKVFWDGKLIGICEHAFSPEVFCFQAGKGGEHSLAIAVENTAKERSAGRMFVTDYDFHSYGGIYDEVVLEELDPFYFDRAAVTPLDLEGNVRVALYMGGKMPEAPCKIFYRFDGGKWQNRVLSGMEEEWKCTVPSPRIWSPEDPQLHTVEFTLDKEKEGFCVTFGIRIVETRKGEILLNGKALMLVGYNRHDCHPDFGYAVPEKIMLEDLKMIKAQGCNFIRGSHYPQREKFLDLCDRLGLLVWEEVLGWNNQPDHVRHPDFIRLEKEQCRTMVHKSINHPSVIMWGYLNEVYMPEGQSPRALLTELTAILKEEDPSRPVTFAFATGWMNSSDTCLDLADILSFNTYPGWYGSWECFSALHTVKPKLKELAQWASRNKELREKPLIISEVGAAAIPGDHSTLRWSEEYQEELLRLVLEEVFDNARYSGVAIWQFCDVRTHLGTTGILSKPRGFNNKGVLDPYRKPKLAWRMICNFLKERAFDGWKKKAAVSRKKKQG